MAIIKTCCCCCWTLRKGCYASAMFSLVYFFIFAWITGCMTYVRLSTIFGWETYENRNLSREAYNDNFHSGPVQLQTVNLVLDLLCEVAGIFASILLIRALLQERKSWFWPWMIVVPLHIAIDAFAIIGLMVEQLVYTMDDQMPLVLTTIVVDVTLNSINGYGLLCVISQYQEYKAGRGTAAYVEFISQTPEILLETASSTKTVLTKANSLPKNNGRRSSKDISSSRKLCNGKRDTYCEEYSMQTLTNNSETNEKQSVDEQNCQNMNETANNVQNRQVIVANGEESGVATLNSCTYKNVNDVAWNNEKPPKNENISPELKKNEGKSLSTKFGKYLEVKNGTGGKGGRKQSKPLEKDEDFSPSVPLNNKSKTSRYNNEHSSTTKSDSDSEDPTDDVLSAFGIISYAKN